MQYNSLKYVSFLQRVGNWYDAEAQNETYLEQMLVFLKSHVKWTDVQMVQRLAFECIARQRELRVGYSIMAVYTTTARWEAMIKMDFKKAAVTCYGIGTGIKHRFKCVLVAQLKVSKSK